MERRQYPRLDTRFPAEVEPTPGEVLPVVATNVSVTGMQLECDHPTAVRIAPGGTLPAAHDGGLLEVRVTLPLRDGTHVRVAAVGRVRALRRVAEDEYRLGVEYQTFHGHSYRALEAFIDDWMTYADEA